ncbi:MAG: methylated-DNA--[protein]-cysteine S-methyltransferase [Halobacteria archaeon]|nr:methylated-DNA--[protein]-cysteine S-methyltransferase [Halobacteria archaeon]
MKTGIFHRYSDYLESYVQVGTAGDKVVSVSFPETPDEDSIEDGLELLDSIFEYLDREDTDLSEYDVGLTLGGIERSALLRTRDIPRGTTITYEELAESIGADEDDYDDVREALVSNPVPVLLPCHRVVEESGIGDYTGDTEIKRRLLELEDAH